MEQSSAMWDVTPGIQANGEIERGGRELEGVDVPMAKPHQMAEPTLVRSHLGLRMADDGDVHADNLSP